MTAKFDIGSRVTVAPMEDEDALNGVIAKVWPEDDDGVFYMVELDEPLPGMIDEGCVAPYYLDAAEWELSTLDTG